MTNIYQSTASILVAKESGGGGAGLAAALAASRALPKASAAPVASAKAYVAFVRAVFLPFHRRAGGPMCWVLNDRGPAFKRFFDAPYQALGVRHALTRPRHALTNGLAKGLRGTILQEEWCIHFPRRYFSSRVVMEVMEQTLVALARFCNTRGPRHRCRLQRQSPARLF